jgi:hypothetical protein
MEAFFNFIEKPLDWVGWVDVFLFIFGGFAIGIISGHKLAKSHYSFYQREYERLRTKNVLDHVTEFFKEN